MLKNRPYLEGWQGGHRCRYGSRRDDYLGKPFDAQELKVRICAGEPIVDLEEALRVQATHDALTGAWNHGANIDMLQQELARAEREGISTRAVLVDLDHFKRVNDTYGHLTGDAALREAAQRMTRVLRRSDVLGRYPSAVYA